MRVVFLIGVVTGVIALSIVGIVYAVLVMVDNFLTGDKK